MRPIWPLIAVFSAPLLASAQSLETDRAIAEMLREKTSRSSADLVQTTDPDGGVSLNLGPGFKHVYLARLDQNGLQASCVASVPEANQFFGRNLETGKKLPRYLPPAPTADAQAAQLHGLTLEQYQFYWNLIEQAKVDKAAKAVSISIQNNDGPGEGFNDNTLVSPEGGNNGATRGQQRLNVFDEAASIWEAFLDSNVPIVVAATFDSFPGQCGPGGGVLGFAGATTLHRDFPNAEVPGTWYFQALANKMRRSDNSAAQPDIVSAFNSDIDTGCLGGGSRFYYGLDNATPANRINLLVTVLHEIGHGVGSASATDESTGAFPGSPPFPDIWARFQFDTDANQLWAAMTPGQRVTSAINSNDLVWNGPSTRIASGFLVAGREADGSVQLFTPNPVQPGSSVSHWNDVASPNLLMEPAINPGLPLTLDLTRQQMRDIGWFRDTNTADSTRDSITGVTPTNGTSVTPGSNVNISWTNVGGFNRNVTIELSTDAGLTFPTTIASNVANSGSRSWIVPSSPTATARIRVREHDFAAPSGVSSENFTIGTANSAPTFTPGSAITRVQGSAPGAAVTIGTITDPESSVGSLTVTAVSGGTASGLTVTNINNPGSGSVSANIAASCTAGPGTQRFRVSDGSLNDEGDLQVNITSNPLPTLSYSNQTVNGGSPLNVNPTMGPSDNGSVASVAVQSVGTYTGTISVNAAGVIALSNTAPVGAHTITIRATDNCGAIRNASFTLTVNNTAPNFVPAGSITRQEGSPAGPAVVIGAVSDPQQSAGSLLVSAVAGGTATNINVGAIVNNAGAISAPLAAACGAAVGVRTQRFQVSDGNLANTGDLALNVLANEAPILSAWPNAQVANGGSANVTPAAAPTDNGSIVSATASANPGSFTGTLNVNPSSGVVGVVNAGPDGVYVVTVQVTDNCGSANTTSFNLTVGDGVFANGFE